MRVGDSLPVLIACFLPLVVMIVQQRYRMQLDILTGDLTALKVANARIESDTATAAGELKDIIAHETKRAQSNRPMPVNSTVQKETAFTFADALAMNRTGEGTLFVHHATDSLPVLIWSLSTLRARSTKMRVTIVTDLPALESTFQKCKEATDKGQSPPVISAADIGPTIDPHDELAALSAHHGVHVGEVLGWVDRVTVLDDMEALSPFVLTPYSNTIYLSSDTEACYPLFPLIHQLRFHDVTFVLSHGSMDAVPYPAYGSPTTATWADDGEAAPGDPLSPYTAWSAFWQGGGGDPGPVPPDPPMTVTPTPGGARGGDDGGAGDTNGGGQEGGDMDAGGAGGGGGGGGARGTSNDNDAVVGGDGGAKVAGGRRVLMATGDAGGTGSRSGRTPPRDPPSRKMRQLIDWMDGEYAGQSVEPIAATMKGSPWAGTAMVGASDFFMYRSIPSVLFTLQRVWLRTLEIARERPAGMSFPPTTSSSDSQPPVTVADWRADPASEAWNEELAAWGPQLDDPRQRATTTGAWDPSNANDGASSSSSAASAGAGGGKGGGGAKANAQKKNDGVFKYYWIEQEYYLRGSAETVPVWMRFPAYAVRQIPPLARQGGVAQAHAACGRGPKAAGADANGATGGGAADLAGAVGGMVATDVPRWRVLATSVHVAAGWMMSDLEKDAAATGAGEGGNATSGAARPRIAPEGHVVYPVSGVDQRKVEVGGRCSAINRRSTARLFDFSMGEVVFGFDKASGGTAHSYCKCDIGRTQNDVYEHKSVELVKGKDALRKK